MQISMFLYQYAQFSPKYATSVSINKDPHSVAVSDLNLVALFKTALIGPTFLTIPNLNCTIQLLTFDYLQNVHIIQWNNHV